MKKMTRGVAVLVALLLLMLPMQTFSIDFGGNNDPNAKASAGDIAIAKTPIAVDDKDGNVIMRLYFLYKGSNVLNGMNLSLFEVNPIVEKPEDFPFDITWTSYRQGLGDIKKSDPIEQEDGTVLGGITEYMEYAFRTKKDVVNGYYPITFSVKFLHSSQKPAHEAAVEDKVTVYIKVENGTPPATPTPSPSPSRVVEATPKPQAKVILAGYTISPEKVVSGDAFTLKMTLENTNANMAVRNMKCAITETEGQILPSSGSNSFFIESIAAGETHTIELPMQAMPDAGVKPIKMTLTMQYDDRVGNNEGKEEFTLPIRPEIKVKIDEPMYGTEQFVDQPFNVMLAFYNVGRGAMRNTTVTLESDTMKADETYFVGTMEAGASASYDAMVTVSSADLPMGEMPYDNGGEMGDPTPENEAAPSMDGMDGEDPPLDEPEADDTVGSTRLVGLSVSARPMMSVAVFGGGGGSSSMQSSGGPLSGVICSGNIIITYEDDFGVEYRKETPIQVGVQSHDQAYGNDQGMMGGYEWDPETGYLIDPKTGDLFDPYTMEPVERGTNPIVPIAICGAAVLVVVAVVVVLLNVRKKKKARMMEQEIIDEVD